MIERKDITEILGIAVKIRRPKNQSEANKHGWSGHTWHSCLLICRASNGQVIAAVEHDELFDRKGDRFNIND